MAPPNNPVNSIPVPLMSSDHSDKHFDLSDGIFSVNGVPILSDVPNNVTFSPFMTLCKNFDAPLPLLERVVSKSHKGGFIGFEKEAPSDRLINSIGQFAGREFLSVFRFKTWWSTMWVGNSGSDLQMETQWLLFNVPEINAYVIILPIIEGSFRSAIQPGSDNHVMICAESGSTQVMSSSFDSIAYVHVSDNPYDIMKDAFSAVRVHLNTFRLLEEKVVPPIVDKFGWCTWDSFYLTVEPAGVWHGVNEFNEGGICPRFIIIDDGWQSINLDDTKSPTKDQENLVLGGTQMTARLHRLDEGEKFRKYKGGSMLGPNPPSFNPRKPKQLISKAIDLEHAEKARDKAIKSGVTDLSAFESEIMKFKHELAELFGGTEEKNSGDNEDTGNNAGDVGMKAFTRDLRKKFQGLDDIYVWHALCGAWGGVRPESTHLSSKVVPVIVSPGLDGTMDDLAVIKIVEGGIGLVRPSQSVEYYDAMHSHLADSGITGVKVDVIHTLEYISEDYGGRVELAKDVYKGLTNSLVKNFNGSGLISSMQQANDFLFLGTKQISMGRVGDDFWFMDPNGDPMGVYWLQGVHMIHCAYNSMWIGQIVQPDWDMFQSDHICAKFHAGSRAICGGPVYLSDSLGGHNFDLIKQLVFPDGTVPKCEHFALPTRDCLFRNPLFDQETVLKIWNFNKYGGVVGAFNCQGAGWDSKERRIKGHSECYMPMTVSVHVYDVEWDQSVEAAKVFDQAVEGEFVVYLDQMEQLFIVTAKSNRIQVSIQPSTFEIFSFTPIMKLGDAAAKFAPVGLANMFNSGGTIQELKYNVDSVEMKIKGGGHFLAYASEFPKKCYLNGVGVDYFELSDDGKLSLFMPWIEETGGVSSLEFVF
ncbi:hypothetical protein ACFE04_002958 [Oxalis oulophora]